MTLVDAASFPGIWHTEQVMQERDDLSGGQDAVNADPCLGGRRVVDLLTTQIEKASVMVANKGDMATADEMETTLAMCRALNEAAVITQTDFGKVPLSTLLPLVPGSEAASDCSNSGCGDPKCADPVCGQEEVKVDSDCSNPGSIDPCCADTTCGEEKVEEASDCGNPGCSEPGCADTTCGEEKVEEASDCGSCADTTCGGEEVQVDADCGNPSCSDPGCADTTCGGEEVKAGGHRLDVDALGFTNFVFRSDRPFHESRLLGVIDKWPLPTKDVLSLKELQATAAATQAGSAKIDLSAPLESTFNPDGRSPFEAVLRSKGWTWLHRYPTQEIFWTHAGRHFALERLPDWAARPLETLEEGQSKQEIVFIGMGMDEELIREQLEECLLNDEEMVTFEKQLRGEGHRFKIGQAIEAYTGDGWTRGEVVALNYREDAWPASKIAPYQIRLSDGMLIFAPFDDDGVVRKAEGAELL